MAAGLSPCASIPAADLHVRARRVLDRPEFVAADLARRDYIGAVTLEPCEPIRPPGAAMLGRVPQPFVDVGAVRLTAGPVLVLALRRRVDDAGDVAGPGEHESHRPAEILRAVENRFCRRDMVFARREIVDRHLDLPQIELDAADLHLAFA